MAAAADVAKMAVANPRLSDADHSGLKTLIAQLPSTSPAAPGVFDFLVVALLQNTDSVSPLNANLLYCSRRLSSFVTA